MDCVARTGAVRGAGSRSADPARAGVGRTPRAVASRARPARTSLMGELHCGAALLRTAGAARLKGGSITVDNCGASRPRRLGPQEPLQWVYRSRTFSRIG